MQGYLGNDILHSKVEQCNRFGCQSGVFLRNIIKGLLYIFTVFTDKLFATAQ